MEINSMICHIRENDYGGKEIVDISDKVLPENGRNRSGGTNVSAFLEIMNYAKRVEAESPKLAEELKDIAMSIGFRKCSMRDIDGILKTAVKEYNNEIKRKEKASANETIKMALAQCAATSKEQNK